jgi:hypothetical protein
VDYNVGTFAGTLLNAGDELTAISGALAFRPVNGTVIRVNYRYGWARDVFDNGPVRSAALLIGLSTYF